MGLADWQKQPRGLSRGGQAAKRKERRPDGGLLAQYWGRLSAVGRDLR